MSTLVLTGCKKIAQEAGERVLEKVIEGEGGDADVEIDFDGQISLEGVDEDGNDISVQIDAEAGTATFEVEVEVGSVIEFGEDLDIPDGLTISVPDGGTVKTAVVRKGLPVSVLIEYKGDRQESFVDLYANELKDIEGFQRLDFDDEDRNEVFFSSELGTVLVGYDDDEDVTTVQIFEFPDK